MDKFLTFTIVGLTVASIYAIFASGLVLTYTTTGIFNFAHGAAGMLFAFVYWQLRFDWGWSAPLSLVVVLLVLAPLFGVLLELATPSGFKLVTDTKPNDGIFNCSPKNVYTLKGDYGKGVTLKDVGQSISNMK